MFYNSDSAIGSALFNFSSDAKPHHRFAGRSFTAHSSGWKLPGAPKKRERGRALF
jgi:hypothetical protein